MKLAMLSWHFVEKPALALKAGLRSRRAPLAEANAVI
jgi:peptidoglycan/LPS O-acetylase OafA/YrhL